MNLLTSSSSVLDNVFTATGMLGAYPAMFCNRCRQQEVIGDEKRLTDRPFSHPMYLGFHEEHLPKLSLSKLSEVHQIATVIMPVLHVYGGGGGGKGRGHS